MRFIYYARTMASGPKSSALPLKDIAPPLNLLLQEARWLPNLLRARHAPEVRQRDRIADGDPVLTLPGLCASDDSMKQLRLNLNAVGFSAKRWKLGRNFGAREDTIDRIDKRVRYIHQQTGRRVHLVGWSLGGIMAREYAKWHPDLIASVVTLGSPFSGSLKTNHAWRLYELVARHKVEELPIELHESAKPPVPTYALWSPQDGVVSHYGSHGGEGEADQSFELDCGHMGFAFDQRAIDAVIDCLADARARIK